MPTSVKVLSREQLFNDFVAVDRVQLCHELFSGGMSPPLRRLAVHTPDSVAALLTDVDTDELVFVRQFRFPVYENSPDEAWLLELVAGRRKPDENADVTMRREIAEECRYEVASLDRIAEFYATPGAVTERIRLYHAKGRSNPDLPDTPEHGEDLDVIRLSRKRAIAMLDSGDIRDAKTFAALAWLKAQQAE